MRHTLTPLDELADKSVIFVFGSNKAGIHGGGAARYAFAKLGAQMRNGFGRTGQAYAIPTKGFPGGMDRQKGIGSTLELKEIQGYVMDFLAYAEERPKLRFKVTQIGCGLAGLNPKDIAPMFKHAPSNCYFDTAWAPDLGPLMRNYWGTL